MNVTIHRWPVLRREVDDLGRLKRTKSSYRRMGSPAETRQEKLLGITRTRARVTFGGGDAVLAEQFLLKRGGRMLGSPDWVLDKDSLKALRKQARELEPKRKPRERKS